MLKLNWETGTFHKLPEHSTSYRNLPQATGTFHKLTEHSTSGRNNPQATARFHERQQHSNFVSQNSFSEQGFQTMCSKLCFSKIDAQNTFFLHLFQTQFSTNFERNLPKFGFLFSKCARGIMTHKRFMFCFFCFDSRFLPRPSAGGGLWPRPATFVKWGR